VANVVVVVVDVEDVAVIGGDEGCCVEEDAAGVVGKVAGTKEGEDVEGVVVVDEDGVEVEDGGGGCCGGCC
jgi:uncharacterized membrane protein